MSLSFLGQKSFHPSNPQNLRKLFQAEEKKAQEAKKAEELKRQWEEEETRRHSRSLLEKGAPAEAPSSTAFMYQLPPGLKEAQERQKAKTAAAAARMDAAAAAASSSSGGGKDAPQQTQAERDAERFAILQNAPREWGSEQMDVKGHRPLGMLVRNVKCKRCGEWGHSAGDRECKMRNELTANDAAAKQMHDPLQRASAGAEAAGGALRWAPKAATAEGVHGGASAEDKNQQYVALVDEDDAAALAAAAGLSGGGGDVATMADLDPAVLSMLDEKQQKQLLKLYQKEQKRERDGDGERERKHKKHHKEKSHHREHKEKKRSHHKSSSSKHHRSDRDRSDRDREHQSRRDRSGGGGERGRERERERSDDSGSDSEQS